MTEQSFGWSIDESSYFPTSSEGTIAHIQHQLDRFCMSMNQKQDHNRHTGKCTDILVPSDLDRTFCHIEDPSTHLRMNSGPTLENINSRHCFMKLFTW